MMLSQTQHKALQALLTEPTRDAAAKAAGITTRTLRNYLSDPEFQSEYAKAFGQFVTDATRQVQKSLSPAISVLDSIVKDENESTGSRISAARSLLEYGLRLTEFNDILRMLNGDD